MPTRIPCGAMVDMAKMAVRHDVSNLARRGNILYWRARVPSTICKSPDGQRISVSLRLSDHVKAARIARRLNLMMAEAEFDGWHRGMCREQIAKFFQAEVEKIRAELDDVAMIARRTGAPDMAREVEADIDVGWAYRLLEKWGTARELKFDSGCPARTELQAAGLTEDAIVRIAETYRSERKGSHRGVFEARLAATMTAFGIEDTPANREHAKTAFFKAQADTLLDYQKRYPDFVHEAPATREAAAPVPADVGIHTSVDTSKDLGISGDDMLVTARPSKPEVRIAADRSSGSPSEGPAPRQDDLPPPERVLPVDQFEAEAERVVRNRRDEWTPDTAVDFRVLVRTFASILAEHGVRDSGEIRQQHIAALRQHYNDIPTRYGQSARLRDLSTAALRAAG
jgi:hypothetical protein